MTTRNETKARLIELGIAPARLPDNDVWNLRRSALTRADLREANLRWANLREAHLSWANLRGANMRGADLSGANLSDANMRDANMRDANLSSANLSSANLSSANLYGAKLSGANMRGADLSGAYMRDANMRDANMRDAIINWNSHDLLAEIARRAAGDDLRQRMTAGLILISRDWCWEKFIAAFDDNTKDWLGSVFAPYVKDGDDAPDIVRQYVKGE